MKRKWNLNLLVCKSFCFVVVEFITFYFSALIAFHLICLFCYVELTEEMEEIIDNALRPHPGGEVLSEGFRLQITRKDMETLAGLNWLNDEVDGFFLLSRNAFKII